MGKIVLILLALFLILSGAWFWQSKYTDWKVQHFVQQHQEERQTSQKQQREEYLKLLNSQSQSAPTLFPPPTSSTRRAQGAVPLHIVLVKPQEVAESTIKLLIDRIALPNTSFFNDCNTEGKCQPNASLAQVNTFYTQEEKKYGVKNFSVQPAFHGVYTVYSLDKIGNFAALWGKDQFGIVKVQDKFDAVLKEHKVNIDTNALVVFLYFDNSFEGQQSDETSFYEHKKFRSFADPVKGRAYINVYNFSPLFSAKLAEIMAHEVLHLFGATDKYQEYSETPACKIIGRGELAKIPPLPQTSADIMCGLVEYEKGKFRRGSLSDNTLVINSETAKEIGW